MLNRIKSATTHDMIRWLMVAVIILVPTVYSTNLSASFTTPKLTVLRIITLAIVGIWSVQCIAQRKWLYRESRMNRWIVLYAIILVLNTVFSRYFWVSVFGDQGRFLGLFTMLNLVFLMGVMMNFFQSKKELNQYVKVSVWTAVALSVYGLLQFKGWVGAENWDQDPTFRVFGTLGHSNHFGAYLVFHVMLLLGLLVKATQPLQKGLYGLALIPMFATILATASRGAFLTLIVTLGLFAMGWTMLHWEWIHKNRKRISGVVAGILVVLLIFNQPISDRFKQLSVTQRTFATIEFIRAGHFPDRVSWWFSALAMVRDHPILGHGLSTFRDTYNLYRRTDYRVPGDEQDRFTPETAHMEVLNIAATQGLLGLMIYLGLIGYWAKALIQVFRRKTNSRATRVMALSFLTAGGVYLIQVLMSFGVVATLTPFFILLGASMSLYHVTTDVKPQREQFHAVAVRGGRLMIGATLMLIVIMLSGWFTARQAISEYDAKQGERMMKAKEVALMLENYEKAAAQMPQVYDYWEMLGKGAFEFGTYENQPAEILEYLLLKSINAYERAYHLVQTQPYITANLALAYVAYGNLKEIQSARNEAEQWKNKGVAMYREAVNVAVNNPLFRYNFGQLLKALGRKEEAWDAFYSILEIRDPYLDTTYQLALIATDLKRYEEARFYIQRALQETPGDEKVKSLLQRINTETSGKEVSSTP